MTGRLLFDGVDAAAEHASDRQAVVYPGESLTYGDLATRSNALAHFLVDAGVRRGDRVGIYAEKSLETATCLHGIMKAGGAYVPIDPSSSAERVASLLQDCGIRHLIASPSKLRTFRKLARMADGGGFFGLDCIIGLPDSAGLPVRCVPWTDVLTGRFPEPPRVGVVEMDLAYIIYTSGSTGKPKGIMHSHYSGLSFARWAADIFQIRQNDRLTNHAPLHFDLSTMDYFAAALTGATTVIVPEAFAKLPASYSQLLENERITVFYTVPFALVQILQGGMLAERDLSTLRLIVFGGEPIAVKHLNALMRQLPHTRFENFYGPAEVNGVTHYSVPREEFSMERVPVGARASTAEFLVVDDRGKEVVKGEVGELLVRSPSMMQGYWARPDLNARAFFRRAVSSGYDHLFYRTGDLVRELPDGNYDFLGRKDRQIKVRGYRVELDAIEAVLASCEAIQEAAAFALADDEGTQHIECVAIPKQGVEVGERELASLLREKLPSYALPRSISLRKTLPRTATDKIDRRQLCDEAAALSRTTGGRNEEMQEGP